MSGTNRTACVLSIIGVLVALSSPTFRRDAMKNRIFVLRQYERLSYEAIGPANAAALERLVDRIGKPIFRFGRHHLQARAYVGLIQVGDLSIQVIPKIYGNNKAKDLACLVGLLGYTRGAGMTEAGAADLERAEGRLLELWIGHFARRLSEALKRNLRKTYVEETDRTGFVRGKLLVGAMRGTENVSGRYPCRYQTFTPDHLLNHILKFCNRLLLSETTLPGTERLLRQNDALLGDVSLVRVEPRHIDDVHLNRLNREYEPLLQMCRVLLENATLNLAAGTISQLALVFEVHRLYEDVVATLIERNRPAIHFGGGVPVARVRRQRSLGKLWGEFGMYVDLSLTDASGRRVLADTKYKALDAESAHRGLSQSDFYQMYGYGRGGHLDCEDIVLLYPDTDDAGQTYEASGLRLHTRQLALRRLVDAAHGTVDQKAAVDAINEALAIYG